QHMETPFFSIDGVQSSLQREGWIVFPDLIEETFLVRLRQEVESAYAIQREIQVRSGVGDGTDGTVHHLPCMRGSFLALLDRNYCGEALTTYFGGPYVLNTFGGVLNLPQDMSYVGKVHHDQRTFSDGLNLMAQLLIMLDDFTEANGATYFMSGSHLHPHRP